MVTDAERSAHASTRSAVASTGTRRAPWVCLMFHDVLPVTSADGGGPERFAVPLATFEQTLDRIAARGARGCSLAEALLPGADARIALTFDDGTRSHFDHAAPALRARGMTATFFVTTDWIGRPGFMTWDELRTLRDWGMSVQSHTRAHRLLSELDAGELRQELAESKAMLDRELAQDTDQIGLPGGDAPRRSLRHLLGECGYRVVAGSRWGVNRTGGTRWIRRCTVRGAPTPEHLDRILAGDPRLAARRLPREWLLATVRSTLGATRYSRWRRALLDGLASASARG